MNPLDKEVAEWMGSCGYEFQLGHYRKTNQSGMAYDFLSKDQATFFYTATKQAELEARKAEHQSWSIVYGIGCDPDNDRLPENVLTLRQKWSRDELEINAQLNQSNKEKE